MKILKYLQRSKRYFLEIREITNICFNNMKIKNYFFRKMPNLWSRNFLYSKKSKEINTWQE